MTLLSLVSNVLYDSSTSVQSVPTESTFCNLITSKKEKEPRRIESADGREKNAIRGRYIKTDKMRSRRYVAYLSFYFYFFIVVVWRSRLPVATAADVGDLGRS